MIDKVVIKNFRGLESFEIDGLGKFNIFVGENSSGKTTILEALFVGLDISLRNAARVQNFRQIEFLLDNISFIFFNFNFGIPISFEFHQKTQTIKTQIEALYLDEYFQDETKQPLSFVEEKTICGLKYQIFNDIKNLEYKLMIDEESKKVRITGAAPIEALQTFLPTCIFLPSNLEQWAFSYFVNQVRDNKQNDTLIKYLKIFNPRVQDVETRDNNVLINLEGIPKLINLNLLGEGFKKYIGIVALLLIVQKWHRKICVCIDEIENGLHPKATVQLLQALEELGRSEDVEIQFFITTHSLEFLELARKHLSESKVFEIAQTSKGAKPYLHQHNSSSPYLVYEGIDPRGQQ